jgi:hypothetical protein
MGGGGRLWRCRVHLHWERLSGDLRQTAGQAIAKPRIEDIPGSAGNPGDAKSAPVSQLYTASGLHLSHVDSLESFGAFIHLELHLVILL